MTTAHNPMQDTAHAQHTQPAALGKPCTADSQGFEFILLVRMSAMHKTHTWKRTLPTASAHDWGLHAGKWHVHDRSLAEVMNGKFPQCDVLRRLTSKMRDMSPPRLLAQRGVSYLHVIRQQVRKRRLLGAKRRAAFHNICGTASLHSCRGMRQLLTRGKDDESWSPFLTRVHSKFGLCTEMYTVQGTASFRVSKEEVAIMNFKGVRDARTFMGMLQRTLGPAWDHGDEPLPVHVHMAIVALILGRAVSVGPACLMMDVLEGVLPCNSIELSCMGEDTFGGVHFKIKSWESIQQVAAQHDARWAVVCDAMQAHAGATTVTVTHKGSVIVRFSWSDTVPWDPLLADSLLFACEALSRLLADCV